MVKALIVIGAASIASSDVLLHDDALSLLQTRVQKHMVNQDPEALADGSVIRVGAPGTLCEDDEDITFAKCVEIQMRQLVPNNAVGHGSVMTKRNLFGDGISPRGCFMLGRNFYFNDQPVGNAQRDTQPVCQVGGGGGRAAEIAAWGISCPTSPDCRYRGWHQMIWDESVSVPELTLGAKGAVCEEGCGLLTFEQCTKAADMGLIDALTPGFTTREQPNHQLFGAVHTLGTLPSGCSVMTGHGTALAYWNSHDTATGAHAARAPNANGDPLVTPSGVGSGWVQVAPLCGVCTTTTTTTTPEVVPEDEGFAVGDPHLMTNKGKRFDLS